MKRTRVTDGSPVVLEGGAWIYDEKGIARWVPGAVSPYAEGESA